MIPLFLIWLVFYGDILPPLNLSAKPVSVYLVLLLEAGGGAGVWE